MNQFAMIVKAASESLTNSPRDFSTRNATICCTSENAEKSDLDAVFRKSPSELLKYLLVINHDTYDSDAIETNAAETEKKAKNNVDESSAEDRKFVTHGKIAAVTNKTKQNSFCTNFHDDKRALEMGVLSLSCDSVKCGVVSFSRPLPDLKDGRMDERYGEACETSEKVGKIQSSLFSEDVQSFREVLQRTISSEESTRTEQFSDDDLSLLPEVLPPETLDFILSGTEKNLHIESPDSGPTESASECSEFTELVPLSNSSSKGSVSLFSPVASTSQDFSAVKPSTSAKKDNKKLGDKSREKETKDVGEDEMVLVPSGKSNYANV